MFFINQVTSQFSILAWINKLSILSLREKPKIPYIKGKRNGLKQKNELKNYKKRKIQENLLQLKLMLDGPRRINKPITQRQKEKPKIL